MLVTDVQRCLPLASECWSSAFALRQPLFLKFWVSRLLVAPVSDFLKKVQICRLSCLSFHIWQRAMPFMLRHPERKPESAFIFIFKLLLSLLTFWASFLPVVVIVCFLQIYLSLLSCLSFSCFFLVWPFFSEPYKHNQPSFDPGRGWRGGSWFLWHFAPGLREGGGVVLS